MCLKLFLLTLHGLNEALDGVWADAERSTFLHQNRRDVVVHVQVVNRLRLQAQRVHELPAGGGETSHMTIKTSHTCSKIFPSTLN